MKRYTDISKFYMVYLIIYLIFSCFRIMSYQQLYDEIDGDLDESNPNNNLELVQIRADEAML